MDNKIMKRRFLGKTENFDSKGEKAFYDKMLKAYIKGKTYFSSRRRIAIVAQDYYAG